MEQVSERNPERDEPPTGDPELVDAAGVIRCLADPDDETLLSAAVLARQWLALDADTPDAALADLAADLDVRLRDQLHVTSDRTVQALQRMRDALRVHDLTAAAVPPVPHTADRDLVETTLDRIDPAAQAPHLTPAAVRDIVTQTIVAGRSQAIQNAVAAVRAAYAAIDQAEAAHQDRLRDLKATLRERIETAVQAGRPVTALAADLQLTRQRLDQIRKNTR